MTMIVVIDDSPTRRLVLGRWLRRLGHGVQSHANLPEMLERENPSGVDLVLLALVMDDGNGFDGGIALKTQGFSPIVLLADIARTTDDLWARAQGLAGVLSWPFTEAMLGRVIDEALRSNRNHGDDDAGEEMHG